MFVKFDSPRSSSIYMHSTSAQVILEKIGKELTPTGIIEQKEIAQALKILEDWYDALPRLLEPSVSDDPNADQWEKEEEAKKAEKDLPPTQKARLWPFIELLKEVAKQQVQHSYITWKNTAS